MVATALLTTDVVQDLVDGEDITDLLEAAWAEANGTLTAAADGEMSFLGTSNGIIIMPAGVYRYSGEGLPRLSQATPIFKSAGQTTIILDSDCYLFDLSGPINGFECSGIKSVGGKGLFRWTVTGSGVNVAGPIRFDGVIASDYSECGVNFNGQDVPHVCIDGCLFIGAMGGSAIGVALCGYNDQSYIKGCQFHHNRHNIKLAPGVNGSGTDKGPACNMVISGNDLTKFAGTDKVSDIWIVPNAETSTNAAWATMIQDQKFGNENYAAGQFKILIADEDGVTGSDNGTKNTHSVSKSDGYVGLISFDTCHFGWGGTANGAYGDPAPVYSYARRVFGVQQVGCTCAGVAPAYASLQFDDAAAFDGGALPALSILQPGPSEESCTRRVRLSNEPFATVLDTSGTYQSDLWVPHLWSAGEDVAYVDLLPSDDITTDGGVSNASRTGATDAFGGTNAITLTFSSNAGYLYLVPVNALMVKGRLAWIEIDLAEGESNPISGVQVTIRSSVGFVYDRRTYAVPETWQTFRFPWFPVDPAATYRLEIKALSTDYTASVANTVRVGRPRVYHARNPVSRGRLVSAPASATAAGKAGEWSFDGSYIYMCHAKNTWKRAALSTW